MAKKLHIHERRHITFAEYGALLGTRAMLALNALTTTDNGCLVAGEHKFNMRRALLVKDCGTVGCIGGHMALIMGKTDNNAPHFCGPDLTATEYVETGRSDSLLALFYPPREYNYKKITPAQAVKAIDNWLRTGEPMWHKLGLTKGYD